MQFERAIQVLCDAGVEFVVIGGVSAAFHGSSRVTFDLDICFSRTPENLRRVTATLAPFHPRPRGFPDRPPFVWDATLDLPSLIQAKRAAGREKDLAIVAELESLLEADDAKD
jgi:hypothetical protein